MKERAMASSTKKAQRQLEWGFTLFETPIGRCGIVWTEQAVAGVQLPEARDAATRARIQRMFPDARERRPPQHVQRVMDAIVALLRGEASDLTGVALDMSRVPPFHRRVYEMSRKILPGATLSYGEVARQLGKPGAARAVGQALGRNPFAIVVPCHRVLAAGGKVGGFTANGGVDTKLRMLALERARAGAALTLFSGDQALGFDPELACEHLRASDPVLGRLMDRVGPFTMRLRDTPSVFAALAEAIVYQQLNGKAAAAIFGRVRALLGDLEPAALLSSSDEALRGAGLSRAKLLALRDLARRAQNAELPSLAEARTLSDEQLVERLTLVRGVGRWTVEMLLMFRLGRPDVLPTDDFGVRKGFALTFRRREPPSAKDVAARGERWKPYRSVASWYLWRATELSNSRVTEPVERVRRTREG